METSLVNYKSLERTKRVDAEFYNPFYLKTLKILNRYKTQPITQLCKVSDGNHMSIANYFQENPGIPYYRGQDINTDFFLENANPVYIPEEIYDRKYMKRSYFKPNDILLSIVGTVGSLSLVTDQIERSTGSCKLAILRPRSINPEYLAIFLMCLYGNSQVKRNVRGAVQTGLLLEDMDQINVYVATQIFQSFISSIIKQALSLNRDFRDLYLQAEQILSSKLGLTNWQPKHQLSFAKNFSDTKSADRIDAEYFQPFYDEVKRKLSTKKLKTLDSLCALINYGTVPTSPYFKTGIPYIKGLNLIGGFVGGEIDKITNTEKLPKKFFTKENDIIISQMGTVGKAGLVTKDQENYVLASFTIRIRLENYNYIDPYVLTLFINKIARPYYLLRKIAQASVRQNTDLPTIKNLLVPSLSAKAQNIISSKIKQSYISKLKSKKLLEITKQGVQIAIEKDESTAENWIKEQTHKLGVKI